MTTHETQIIADAEVPLVRIIREFDAPPEKVFRAHTDPDLVAQGNGPRGTDMRIDHYDCRTGGSYRFVHVSDGVEYGFRGCFDEVRPAEVIGGGRTRLTATSLVDSFEGRDAFLASGMDEGVRQGYERLDQLLAG